MIEEFGSLFGSEQDASAALGALVFGEKHDFESPFLDRVDGVSVLESARDWSEVSLDFFDVGLLDFADHCPVGVDGLDKTCW